MVMVAGLPLWLMPGSPSKSLKRRMMLSADKNCPPEIFSASTQWLNVMKVQGAITLRSKELADLADSVTREVPPALGVVRGLCFHRTSTHMLAPSADVQT